ncbi:neuronal growth regulator 1-like [Diadema antillarum]|uniref:neuronal growth regulator 1-like n=1 Tax=Diadema antillarum TaxID=105358 RepID=UPI003A8C2768
MSVLVERTGNYTQRADLQFSSIRRYQAARYACSIKSSSGIFIKDLDLFYNVNVQYAARIEGIGPQRPPHYSSMSPDVLVFNETDDVSLECNVTGEPFPTVSWYHGKTRPYRRLKIDNSSRPNVLRLPNITRHKSGWYKCVASNNLSIKNVSRTVHVNVQWSLTSSDSPRKGQRFSGNGSGHCPHPLVSLLLACLLASRLSSNTLMTSSDG